MPKNARISISFASNSIRFHSIHFSHLDRNTQEMKRNGNVRSVTYIVFSNTSEDRHQLKSPRLQDLVTVSCYQCQGADAKELHSVVHFKVARSSAIRRQFLIMNE